MASKPLLDPPQVVKHARSARTCELIEAAALHAFSDVGFDAATTRSIAAKAGVKQQLITYHYKSKLGLWETVIDRLFTNFENRLEQRAIGLQGVDEMLTLKLIIREYLLFCAENPQMARLMSHEGATKTSRLTWLYKRYTKEMFRSLRGQMENARKAGAVRDVDPDLLMYVLMGASAMFSQVAEFKMQTGKSVTSPDIIESYIDLVIDIVFPKNT